MSITTSANAVTLYFRSDQDTVSGVTADRMSLSNSRSPSMVANANPNYNSPPQASASINSINILHSDGTTTNLATSFAMRSGGLAAGVYSDQWQCPEIILKSSDALMISQSVSAAGSPTKIVTWVTKPLGWQKLKLSTWTFYRSLSGFVHQLPNPYAPPNGLWLQAIMILSFGDDACPSRIEGIDFVSYMDIGLAVKNGSKTIKIGVLPLQTSHKLRICKDGVIYGIPLLSISDGNASAVRIFDGTEVKALPEIK